MTKAEMKDFKRRAEKGDMEAYYELLDEYERRKKEKKNENENEGMRMCRD